jgi:hypothetical protein
VPEGAATAAEPAPAPVEPAPAPLEAAAAVVAAPAPSTLPQPVELEEPSGYADDGSACATLCDEAANGALTCRTAVGRISACTLEKPAGGLAALTAERGAPVDASQCATECASRLDGTLACRLNDGRLAACFPPTSASASASASGARGGLSAGAIAGIVVVTLAAAGAVAVAAFALHTRRRHSSAQALPKLGSNGRAYQRYEDEAAPAGEAPIEDNPFSAA